MRIAVAAPCTGSKWASGGVVALGTVTEPSAPLAERFGAWTRAVETAAAEQVVLPAGDLYKGQTWAETRRLFAAGADRGLRIAPRVLSAGLGLLDTAEPVPAYAATFSEGSPDSVATGGTAAAEDHRSWWAMLCGWRGTSLEGTLAATGPDAVDGLVVAASPAYAAAVSDDLRRATGVGKPVVLLTTADLEDADLRGVAARVVQGHREDGGLVTSSDQALVPAVARAAVEALGPDVLDVGAVRDLLAARVGWTPPRDVPPVTDAELDAFVRGRLAADPGASWSRLHGELRHGLGRRIGTERFKRAFAAAGGRLERGAQERLDA